MNMNKLSAKLSTLLMVACVVAGPGGTMVIDASMSNPIMSNPIMSNGFAGRTMESTAASMDSTPVGKIDSKITKMPSLLEMAASPAGQKAIEQWKATDGAKYFTQSKVTESKVSKINSKSKELKNRADYSLSSVLDSDETLGGVLETMAQSNFLDELSSSAQSDKIAAKELMSTVQKAAADIQAIPTKASIANTVNSLFAVVDQKTDNISANTVNQVKDAMTTSLMSNDSAAKEMQALATMVEKDVLKSAQLTDLSDFLMGLLQLAVDGARKVSTVNNFWFESSLPLLPLPVALDIFDSLLPTWPVNFLSYDKSLASSHYVSGLAYKSGVGKTVLDIYTTTL